MEIFYKENNNRKLKKNILNKNKIHNMTNMREFPKGKTEYISPKTHKNTINNKSYNYLHQTSSSLSKMRKSKSKENIKILNLSKNNSTKNYKNINNPFKFDSETEKGKEISKVNINKKNLQKKIFINLNNQKADIYQKEKAYFDKGKSLYHTVQNFYKYFPKPEPMPKKINCNESTKVNNALNIKIGNIYDEKNKYNKKEDKNILYLLTNLNLQNLYNNFTSNCVGFNDLFLLTKDDFVEMKIPIGPRNRILHFLYEYKKLAKNFDFNELSNFLNYYKKIINKPLTNEINNNKLFILTKNINNKSFNCFKRTKINNTTKNQIKLKKDEFKIKQKLIENKNVYPNNEEVDNIIKINKNKQSENEKVKHNLYIYYNNNTNKNINNNLKEKKRSNDINYFNLRKYNSFNYINGNISQDSNKKQNEFSENLKNDINNINTLNLNLNQKNKNKSMKSISSKNLKRTTLKNNLCQMEDCKQNENRYNSKDNSFYDKKEYKNMILNNYNNSIYLLQRFKNIKKEMKDVQKNFSKNYSKDIDEMIPNYYVSQRNPYKTQMDESLFNYINNDFEDDNIINLNYRLSRW